MPKPTFLGASKSLLDDSPASTPRVEVRGVKEYAYGGVFGTAASQRVVYDAVAAPLVEGLFPSADANRSGNTLRESALLFTLGVTNAG